MPDTILLADTSNPDPSSWASIEEILSDSEDITANSVVCEHQDYSSYQKLANGKLKGRGLPIVTLRLKAIRELQRESFRAFCTGLSEEVYLRAPTNETIAGERVYKDYLCIMNWVQRAELVNFAWVELFELVFTHCEAVVYGS